MSLIDYDSKSLTKAIGLLKKRDALKTELDAIEAEIDVLESGARPARGAGKGGTRKRGQLKELIIKELKAAGKEGSAPKTLAAKLKATPLQINAWFAATGKKIKEVKRIGRGKYAWVE